MQHYFYFLLIATTLRPNLQQELGKFWSLATLADFPRTRVEMCNTSQGGSRVCTTNLLCIQHYNKHKITDNSTELTTAHQTSSVQRGCSNTASPFFLHSVFLQVMTTLSVFPSNLPVDLFILSLPYLTLYLSPDVIVEKLSSNLHSMVFQKWTLTSLKYLIPVYLHHTIHPFKAFYWPAIIHHIIYISPSLPFTKMSLLKEFFLYLIPVLYLFCHQNEFFPHFLLFCIRTSTFHLLNCTHKSHPFSSN